MWVCLKQWADSRMCSMHQKPWRQQKGLRKHPSHWDVLELSLHTVSLYLFICFYLFGSHSSSTLKLCSQSLSNAAQGTCGFLPLALKLNRGDVCYLNAARSLSAHIGPGWPSGQLVHVCRCQTPIAFPQWTSAVCVEKLWSLSAVAS